MPTPRAIRGSPCRRVLMLRILVLAPKGPDKSAQGNALEVQFEVKQPCAAATMKRTLIDRSRYENLRNGRRTLGLLAPLIQVGFLALGFGIFLDQSRSLLSDAQFTWGERQVMGIIALLALGGCGFAGWVVGRLIAVLAELLTVLADDAEASLRTSELLELHVVPALGRIALALERMETSGDRTTKRERP
jgi:hypothetical protein